MRVCFLCNRVFDGSVIEKHECQKKGLVYYCPHPDCFYSSVYPHRVQLHNSAIHFKYKKFKCPVKGCTFKAAQMSDMRKHALKHNNEYPHKCNRCDKRFKAKEAYFTHMRLMHPGEYEKMKPHQCACGKRYKFRSNMCRHIVMCDHSQF